MKKTFTMSTAVGAINITEPIILCIYTDEGLCGYGETDVIPGFSNETPETIVQILLKIIGPNIIGKDPLNIAQIHVLMDGLVKANHSAKAAVDIACYDILGKYAGLPVYKLLGGALNERIPMMRSLGSSSPEETVNETREYKKQGYNTVMIKVGAGDVEFDAERIRATRDAFKKDLRIIVDANQGWDIDRALKFCRLVKNCDVDLLEQPVPDWDVDSLAKIRRKTDIPISADEGVHTIHDARRLIEKEAVDIFSIKVTKHGGIYRAKEIMGLAEAYGIRCLMNSMLEQGIAEAASLQLGAIAPNLADLGHAYFSPLRLEEDISSYSSQLQNGYVKISEKSGLGIDIRPDILQKYTFQSFDIGS